MRLSDPEPMTYRMWYEKALRDRKKALERYERAVSDLAIADNELERAARALAKELRV